MRFLLLALAALVGTTATLAAQQIPSPYDFVEERQSLGVFAGYLQTNTGELDLGVQPLSMAGVRYNIRFAGPAVGEAALSLGPSQRRIFANVAPDGQQEPNIQGRGETDALLLLAEAGLRFHLAGQRTWRNLAPYLVATGGVAADLTPGSDLEGVGDEVLIPEDERFRFGPALAVGLGAGTDWFPVERISLRLEVRDQIWRLTTPDGLSAEAESTQWTNNFGISLGAAYHF